MRHTFPLLLLSLSMLLSSSAMQAQVKARTVFVAMPDSVIPYLSSVNRLDMIDFVDSDMEAKVTNLLDGESIMTSLADDSLTINLSTAVEATLFLLNTTEPVDSATQVVALVTTYKLHDCKYADHDIRFFNLSWQPISKPDCIEPAGELRLRPYTKNSTLKFFDNVFDED